MENHLKLSQPTEVFSVKAKMSQPINMWRRFCANDGVCGVIQLDGTEIEIKRTPKCLLFTLLFFKLYEFY